MFYAAFIHTDWDNYHVIKSDHKEMARTAMRHYLRGLGMSAKTTNQLISESFDTPIEGKQGLPIIIASKTQSASAGMQYPADFNEGMLQSMLDQASKQLTPSVL